MTDACHKFSMFMDSTKMQDLFQNELPDCVAGNWQLTGCEIQHPRFKSYLNPKSREKSFLALAYHLKGINQQTSAQDDRILYAKAFLGERSHAEYLKICSEINDSHRQTVMHLDKYGMVGCFFPYDPALPWLTKILDNSVINGYLARFLLVELNGFPPVIKGVAITVINYRPEIRCTYRLDIQKLSGNTKVIYGKTFADDKGDEIHRRMVALYKHAEIHSNSFFIPPPLGYDAMLHTLWMEGLHGQALVKSINEDNVENLMSQLARNLYDFHRVDMPNLESLSEADQFAEIQKKSAKLQQALPTLARRIEKTVCHLREEILKLPLLPVGLIHGDFHIQQLLLMPDKRIALFDFDELAIANPLVDLANFSADLYALNLGKAFTKKLITYLFTAYQNVSRNAICDTHFGWHLQIQLLTRAYRAYIQQKPNLEQLVSQYLELAEAVVV